MNKLKFHVYLGQCRSQRPLLCSQDWSDEPAAFFPCFSISLNKNLALLVRAALALLSASAFCFSFASASTLAWICIWNVSLSEPNALFAAFAVACWCFCLRSASCFLLIALIGCITCSLSFGIRVRTQGAPEGFPCSASSRSSKSACSSAWCLACSFSASLCLFSINSNRATMCLSCSFSSSSRLLSSFPYCSAYSRPVAAFSSCYSKNPFSLCERSENSSCNPPIFSS